MTIVSTIKKFPRTFWVANTIELFERWAWYGFFMLFANYLTGSTDDGGLQFTQVQKGTLMGVGATSTNLKCTSKVQKTDVLSCELPKRRLGRTNAMVSCIGFGGGSRYAMAPERIAGKIIDYAISLGITYFDAARAYGGGKTEKRYGRYLTPNYRDKIFLNSKSQMRDYDGVMKEIEISLKALRTDYLDLYCMHGIDEVEDVDALLSSSGGYKAFLKLKDEGVR